MKLNPPIIDSKINAQYGVELKIPYEQNRSVASVEVGAIQIKIKSVYNSDIATIKTTSFSQGVARFNIDKDLLLVGQHYKIQLAYLDKEGNEGYYSSAGIFKYTAKPSVTIKGLEGATALNLHNYTYTGVYSSEDRTEKVYSYRFKLYDLYNTVLVDSGVMLHNSSQDTEVNSSEDTWTISYSLDYDEVCYLQYSVTTINGLEVESEKYRIADNQALDSNLMKYYYFQATNCADAGCVELSIMPNSSTLASGRKLINGQFNLLRASSDDGYQSWYKMTQFTLASWSTADSKFLCRDYSVNQGTTYKYALQAYNNKGVYSKRIEAKPVTVDFEDIFLSDGEKQLRVRFNPKVSSFKNTVLEQKLDTIGGQYPFFFRNGNTSYKELPISGLISILSDENAEFMQGIQITDTTRKSTSSLEFNTVDYQKTDLVGDNFKRERDFKMEVLAWLNNGKAKLFRSAAEGSFIVRLMNVSLTPNDTLSRMLHTFNATAYEVADCTFENLRKYGMMMDEVLETRDIVFKQIRLADYGKSISIPSAVMATISGGKPNTHFKFQLTYDDNPTDCYLGFTGGFDFGDKEVLSQNPLVGITLESDSWEDAVLLYGYYTEKAYTSFSSISNVTIDDKVAQWMGTDRDEVAPLLDKQKVLYAFGKVYYLKVAEKVENYLGVVSYVPEYNIANGRWNYMNQAGAVVDATPEVYLSYRTEENGPKYYCIYNIGSPQRIAPDKTLKITYTTGDIDTIDVAGQQLSVTTSGRIVLTELSDVESIYLGSGLYADIVYQFITKEYSVETTNDYVAAKKAIWLASGSTKDFDIYYDALISALKIEEGSLIVDAL